MENQDNMRGVDRSKQQSPSVNSRTQSMMVTDSPSVISHMCIDGAKNSPPSQIKMQNARNAYQRNSSSSGMSMPKHASSLSEVGAASLQASLAVEDQGKQQLNLNTPPHSNPRLLSGPQSFTSLGLEHQHHKPTEGDFGYALQRPGNIPAINSDVATVASQQSMGSLASSQGPSGSQHQGYGRMSQSSLPMNSPMERGRLYPGGNQSNNSSSLPNAAGYSNQMPGIVSGSGVSYQGGYGSNNNSFEQSGGLQYLAQQQRDNVRPQMMSDYHHQLLLQEQQKQMAALQQQHQQQLAALQQQQQLAFQQQQQHYVSQLGTTGNGYYYVTSADGTPMLVQSGGAAATMDGASYMVPTQQPQRSFDNDDGGSQSRSVRDDRGRQMPRHGRRHDHRGGAGGMSM